MEDLALLLAQKLATSLLINPITQGNMPYLVVKSKDNTSGHNPHKDKESDSKLDWVDDYFNLAHNPKLQNLPATTVFFDVVEGYSASYVGKLSDHKMLDGSTVSDNFRTDNPTYNLTAKVSNTSRISSHSTATTAEILKEAYAYRLPVYLFLPDITSISGYNNDAMSSAEGVAEDGEIYGYITSLTFKRGADIQDGFEIAMNIAQPQYSRVLDSDGFEAVEETIAENADGLDDGSAAVQQLRACSQRASLSLAQFKSSQQYSDLDTPDELEEDLIQLQKDGVIPEKECKVSTIVATYEKEYIKAKAELSNEIAEKLASGG
jgi:hypothetical protein